MAKAEKFWDFLSANYERGETIPSGRKDIEITSRYLRPQDVVLEYACGTGLLSIEIAARVKEIQAIDISSKMLDRARRNAAEHGIENVHFIHTILSEAEFSPESFDAVLAFNILHLLPDIPQALHRLSALLKPGGLLISNTPCLGEKMGASYRLMTSLIRMAGKMKFIPAVQIVNKAGWIQFITEAGFQIVESEDFHDETLSYFAVARKTAGTSPPAARGHKEKQT